MVRWLLLCPLFSGVSACASTSSQPGNQGPYRDPSSQTAGPELNRPSTRLRVIDRFQGEASWYGANLAGNLTASGEIFDPSLMTAAHRSLPFDTIVRVTRASTGAQVLVRINDRGPFVDGRVIDLSEAAARDLGYISDGHTRVRVEVIAEPEGMRAYLSLHGDWRETALSNHQAQFVHRGHVMQVAQSVSGQASWYGGRFNGRLTANGEIYDSRLLTAAHRDLDFGTLVRVIRLQTGDSVIVRINDRGPYVDDRIIDLSEAAAEILGFADAGVTRVRVDVLQIMGPYEASS